jgi:hypothetical protein
VKQGNGDWDLRVEDENRKSYLVAKVKSADSELASIHTVYERTSTGGHPAILGGFWHDMPYFLGPYVKEGKQSRMWIWPPSVVEGAQEEVNRAGIHEDEFDSACPEINAIKDEITQDGGSWYTGKPFGDLSQLICSSDPLF